MNSKAPIVVGIAVVALGLGAVGFKMKVESKAEESIAKAIEQLSEDFTVKYDDLSVGWTGKDITLSNFSVSPVGEDIIVKVSKVISSGLDLSQEYQPSMCTKLEDATISMQMIYDDNPKLKEFGYGDELQFDLTSCYESDLQAQTVAITEFSFDVKDIGALSYDTSLIGVDLGFSTNDFETKSDDELMTELDAKIKSNSLQVMGLLETLKIENASVQYEDKGLLGKLYNGFADKSGSTVEETRAEIISSIDIPRMVGSTSPVIAELQSVLVSFLKQESTGMRFSSNPKAPLGMSDFMQAYGSVDGLADLIELKSTNKLK